MQRGSSRLGKNPPHPTGQALLPRCIPGSVRGAALTAATRMCQSGTSDASGHIAPEQRLNTVQIRRINEGGMEMSHSGEDPGRFFPACSPGAAPPGNGISGASPEALLRGYMPGETPPWVLPGELALLFFEPS